MKIRNSLILLLTATIWGVAFVAQTVGMDYIGPFTFLFARSVIGGIVLLPVVAVLHKNGPSHAHETAEEKRRARKNLIHCGVCCGAVMCFASILQQIGLLYTTVGKSGFLTACYILIVPLLGLLLGRKCGKLVWCGVALAHCRPVLPMPDRWAEHQLRRFTYPALCDPILGTYSGDRPFLPFDRQRQNVLHPVFCLRRDRGRRHADF